MKKNIPTADRVHMNSKGDQFIADEMWNVLRGLNDFLK